MANIVIVEDNQSIRESLKSYLELEDHTVFEFEKLQGISDLLNHKSIDLMILDVMLPDGNGFIFARELRKSFQFPIIFLTARISESDRITGFEVGGDDYIVKPFSPKEVVLRVNAILKRTGMIKKAIKNQIFSLNKHQLDFRLNEHRIIHDNIEIQLTAAEWEILSYLIKNLHLVISREKLLGECLDYFVEGSERTIDTHIKKIRAKLGHSHWIETVRGYGYKFTGKIEKE